MSISSNNISIIISIINRSKGAFASLGKDIQTAGSQLDLLHKKSVAAFSIGSVTALAGAGIVGLGVKAVSAMDSAADAAIEYQHTVAYSFTQVEDKATFTFDYLSKKGLEFAKKYPIAFEDAQKSIYDVFSSMEVKSKAHLDKVLDTVAKSAVGGLTSMDTATKATIGLVNAFGGSLRVVNKEGKQIDEVTHAGDALFQMVRKGVGDYDKFSYAVGTSAASAVSAGQSIETLGSMLAFLTRKDLTAAQSATSSARAFDAIVKPNTIGRFRKLGVNITDANGNFRQMTDIVVDLNNKFRGMSDRDFAKGIFSVLGGDAKKAMKELENIGFAVKDSSGKYKDFGDVLIDLDNKMKGMSDAEISAMMGNLTKGSGGTIQAMRFFRAAIADNNNELPLLKKYMDEASDGAGALQEAFDEVNKTDKSKLEKFSNLLQSLKISFGELFAKIKVGIADALTPFLEWLDNLSPETKEFIAKVAAIATVVVLVSGAVMVIVGVFMMVKSAISMVTGAFGSLQVVFNLLGTVAAGLGVSFGWVVAIVLAVVAVGILLYQNWETVCAYAKQLYDTISSAFQAIWNAISPTINWIKDVAVAAFNGFISGVRDGFNLIKPAIDSFSRGWNDVYNAVKSAIDNVVAFLTPIFDDLGKRFTELGRFFGKLQGPLNDIATMFRNVFGIIGNIVGGVAGVIMAILSRLWNFIAPIIGFILNLIINGFGRAFGFLSTVFGAIITFISGVIGFVVNLIAGVFNIIKGIFTLNLGLIWNGIKQVITGIFSFLYGAFQAVADIVVGFFNAIIGFVVGFATSFATMFMGIYDYAIKPFMDFIAAMYYWIVAQLSAAWNFIVGIFTTVITAITDFLSWLWTSIVEAITGVYNGIVEFCVNTWNAFVQMIADVINSVVTFFVDLWNNFTTGLQAIIDGVVSFAKSVWDGFVKMTTDVINAIVSFFSNLWNNFTAGFTNIVTSVSNWATSVVEKIRNMASGMIERVRSGIDGVINFFRGMPGSVYNAISSLTSGLYNKAKEFLSSMLNGVSQGFEAVKSFFGNIGSNILSAVGNTGNILLDAGRNIISGFFNGLKRAWEGVKDWFGGLGGWIASHKGPKQYDLKLLVPAGGWIMDGLVNGLDRGIPKLKGKLNYMGEIIRDASLADLENPSVFLKTANPDGTVTSPEYLRRGLGTHSNNSTTINNEKKVEINVDVNTDDSDPKQIAADIAFELSTRLGD